MWDSQNSKGTYGRNLNIHSWSFGTGRVFRGRTQAGCMTGNRSFSVHLLRHLTAHIACRNLKVEQIRISFSSDWYSNSMFKKNKIATHLTSTARPMSIGVFVRWVARLCVFEAVHCLDKTLFEANSCNQPGIFIPNFHSSQIFYRESLIFDYWRFFSCHGHQ